MTKLTVDFTKVDGNTRRATGEGAKPFWYLERTGDLKDVTNEAINDKLGVTKIQIWEPTMEQIKIGILCKVTLETLTTKVDNLSIFPSKYAAGDIFLKMSGGSDGDKGKWTRDCKLTSAGRAQILSHVHSLLKK